MGRDLAHNLCVNKLHFTVLCVTTTLRWSKPVTTMCKICVAYLIVSISVQSKHNTGAMC
jgi:hypothetical protein